MVSLICWRLIFKCLFYLSGGDKDGRGSQQGGKDYRDNEEKGPHRMKRHYHNDGLNGYGGGGGGGGYGGLGGPAYGGLTALPAGNSQSFSKSQASASSVSGSGGAGFGR